MVRIKLSGIKTGRLLRCLVRLGCCGYVTVYRRQREPGVSSLMLSGLAIVCMSEAESWISGGKDLEHLSPPGCIAYLCY